jgi:uncharacterized protein (TIGR03067 family)
MQRMILASLAAVVIVAGCSTPPATSGAAWQGTWRGVEVTPGHEGTATLTVSGQNIEFHGADADDWVKGTFMLREDVHPNQCVATVTECASPDYVGDKCYSIYKLADGALTMTGNGPGDPNIPATFDAYGSREFVFKRDR